MAKRRILTMLDFDDCLFPNTITYYLPVLREMLKDSIRKLNPSLTEEEYLAGEARSLSESGGYFHYWQHTLAQNDADWTNRIYMPMLEEQVKAIKANLTPDPAVAAAVKDLTELGHEVYIVTHGHLNYCAPLAEYAGFADIIPTSHIIDIERAGFQYKSSGAPYRLVRQLAGGEFDIQNMADDILANLRPLKNMGILGHWIAGEGAHANATGHYDYRHSHILEALKLMASQSA